VNVNLQTRRRMLAVVSTLLLPALLTVRGVWRAPTAPVRMMCSGASTFVRLDKMLSNRGAGSRKQVCPPWFLFPRHKTHAG